MRTIFAAPRRSCVIAVLVSAALAGTPSTASAQFGVGGRMAWVSADSDLDVGKVRFVGGQIRLL
jgi:hypothetical protein